MKEVAHNIKISGVIMMFSIEVNQAESKNKGLKAVWESHAKINQNRLNTFKRQ